MSDARKQATEAYVLELGGNYGHDPSIERIARTDVHAVREVFRAGWDAAKADLPGRETLGEVLALVDDYDGCHQRIRDWEALPDWEKEAHPDEEPFSDREDAEFWNRRADAVLSLLRGETKP